MAEPHVDDSALIEGTLAGRQQDFETLVERYQKMLYAFAYRQLQDADAADDVVQATFVHAYAALARFRGEASFKTWVYQIALNECRAVYRARRAQRVVPLDEVPESALPQVEPRSRLDRAALEPLIHQLPPRQRAVLTLRVFSDLPFKEIARVEGISENSAKVNYHHAVVRLKQWLTPTTS
ncbi:MAG TPA: sigma-70 family RNA polymerase sigma factor [Candidatus Kryptonia bacterium]|nr:sigma-70 family RNA polymerase sigma factor [Candidatus Kryptonia bacterium]